MNSIIVIFFIFDINIYISFLLVPLVYAKKVNDMIWLLSNLSDEGSMLFGITNIDDHDEYDNMEQIKKYLDVEKKI